MSAPSVRVQRAVEAAAFAAIFAVCVVVRVVKLGSIPQVIAGDETDNLQVAYRILEGYGPGIFGFDWKPAPIFSLYPLAWTVRVFGSTVSDFRMFSVILSLLTIGAFYFVARTRMGAWAALIAMAIFGTNLWFLHFSRTAWENSNAALFALGACWATTRAIETRRWPYWVLAGVFSAGGLYGYFSGRFIFVSVAAIAVIAVAARLAPWRSTLGGLALAGIVCAVLFAPMAENIVDEWDYFNSRAKTVSVFNELPPPAHPGVRREPAGWDMVKINIERNFKGFILQSRDEMERGLWLRYQPKDRPPLDLITTVLFWCGVGVAIVRWRNTYAWFTFFIPLFIAEVFSRGTPDLARAVIIAPFYFLFVGFALNEVFRRAPPIAPRALAVAAAAAIAAWVAFDNVRDYFVWQDDNSVQMARLPGIDVCEFDLWRGLARGAIAEGNSLDGDRFDRERRTLRCSRPVQLWLPGGINLNSQ